MSKIPSDPPTHTQGQSAQNHKIPTEEIQYPYKPLYEMLYTIRTDLHTENLTYFYYDGSQVCCQYLSFCHDNTISKRWCCITGFCEM